MFDDRYNEAEVAAPQPLDIKASLGEAVEFPIAALPPTLAKAILAIEAIAQVPVSLAAQSVLSAASLAAQGHINVQTITGESCPTSLFFFSIAASGDRKSTSDKLAIKPVKDREEMLAAAYEVEKQRFAIEDAAFKSATSKAKTGRKTREMIQRELEDAGTPPVPPVQPLLTADEPTGPGLQRLFAEAQPALGLFSDEGATFLGGWAMQDENQAATGGMLSKLWDGSPIKRIRADKDNPSTILYGRRLCVHLMVQPDIAGKLLANKAVRSQGLLSRILPVAPKSLKGTRFWREPTDEHRADLEKYHARLAALLAKEFRYRSPETRALDLAFVKLNSDAKARLIEFSDDCEKKLGPNGIYEQVSDFASKMAENAVRLAAVVAYFQGGNSTVTNGLSLTAINAGIAMVEFYAGEAVRLYGAAALDDDSANAVILIDWIRKRNLPAVGLRYLSRSGPTQTRNAATLKRAVAVLIEHRHFVQISGGATLELTGKPVFYADAYTVIPMGDA